MRLFDIQLFASSSTKGGSTSNTTSYSEGGSHSEGGSSSEGGSHSHTESDTHTEGGSHSESWGKSWWSGEVEENTRQHRDAYNTDYEEGQKVTDAYNRLQETIDNKPTFQSKYEGRLEELYNSIMGREKFKYDFNADEMYKMYADKYKQQGKQAMEDTLGKAQAMNGGYGSSYSQSAGQQTYQNYLQQLNDVIPELRNQAYQQYKDEGNELLNKYNVTANAYDREYGQYRDQVADWQADRSFNYGMYSDERNFDYNQFVNERDFWNNEYWMERQSETSNFQITDTNYWEDSHTSSDTDTSFWENSRNWNNTSSWNASQSATNATHWSNTNSAGSGSGAAAKAQQSSAGNTGNTLNPAPYKTSKTLTQSTDQEIQEMVHAYKQASQNAASKKLYESAMRKAGFEDADLELLSKLANNERYWNGNQNTTKQEAIEEIIKEMEEQRKSGVGLYNPLTAGAWR